MKIVKGTNYNNITSLINRREEDELGNGGEGDDTEIGHNICIADFLVFSNCSPECV